MENGYILVHRKLLDNPISFNANYLAIWTYLLLKANHKDNYVILNKNKVLIKRGSFVGSIQEISKRFKISMNTVKYIIDYFCSDSMLHTERTHKYTVFTILNYESYQAHCTLREHSENTERTLRETNNKCNKGKECNKDLNTPLISPQGENDDSIKNLPIEHSGNGKKEKPWEINFQDRFDWLWNKWPSAKRESKKLVEKALKKALHETEWKTISDGVRAYVYSVYVTSRIEMKEFSTIKGLPAWLNECLWERDPAGLVEPCQSWKVKHANDPPEEEEMSEEAQQKMLDYLDSIGVLPYNPAALPSD